MKQSYSFTFMLLPLFLLLAFAIGLFVQRAGIRYEVGTNSGSLPLLPQAIMDNANNFPDKPVEALVLYDPLNPDSVNQVKIASAALDSMKVKYDTFDVNSGGNFDPAKYKTVVVSFLNLEKIEPQILSLVDWAGTGGRVLFSIRPTPSSTFTAIYHKLGIASKSDNLVHVKGVEFRTDLFPGAKDISFSDFLVHSVYPVQVFDDAQIHIVSADELKMPLLWEYNFEKGRFVFINTDQFNEKDDRGMLGAAYSLLQDVFVYPVINTSVFFIDDFPSPIPIGSNDLITKLYGMDINQFYTNIWWPDLEKISKTYNIKYTGGMLEDYNFKVDPPFDIQLNNERQKYFGALNLADGGEIGLHGFNHVPLCLTEAQVNQAYGYPGWPTTESMQLSMYELYRFAQSSFPNYSFTTYIPPSNILCSDSRLWLPTVLPGLRVIAGVYFNNAEKTAYEQEFTEASDGIIELPRIVTGYDPDNLARWAEINELVLHYVNTLYFHPNDVLDNGINKDQTWDFLRGQFEGYVKWIDSSAPGLQNMTAREGAAAVQRFARLAVDAQYVNGTYEISLGNFYDEAWLMLRTSKKPGAVQGGTISPVTSDLYLIKALKSKVVINFEGVNP